MSTRLLVVFPVGRESEAKEYLDFCEKNNPDRDPESIWYPPEQVDRHGRRVVAYLGPKGLEFEGAPFPEPKGGVEARAAGFLSASVEWPSDE